MLLPQKIITALNHLSNVDRRITWLSQGNLLATRTEAVLAEATVEETFPPEFTIPDVHEFLRIVRLFKDPVLKFDAGVVRVMSADLTAEATYAPGNQGHGVALPITGKRPDPPPEQISFRLTALQWRMLQKALGFGAIRTRYDEMRRLVVTGDDSSVMVSVYAGFRMERQEFLLRLDANGASQKGRLVYSAEHLRIAAGA